MNLPKREEGESLYSWELRVFREEAGENLRRWCLEKLGRRCNCECPRGDTCEYHPEYKKAGEKKWIS